MNPNPYPNQNQSYRAAQPGQIQFRSGQMLLFVTTRPFTLGQTGVQVRSGTEILFDGTHAEVEGAQYTLPFLRGAVKAGWMVLSDDYDPNDPSYMQRTSANIQVRHATNGGNPMNPQQRMAIATTVSDEREVGNYRQHAQRTADQNRSYVRGQTPVNVVQPGTKVMSQRGVMEVEVQDGIELERHLSTPAGEKSKERLDLTTEKAARAMKVARDAKVVPGQGMTEEEMMDRMTPEQQAEYVARKEALRAQYVVDQPAPTQALPRPQGRQVVARVQTARNGHHEGMQFTNSVGGGTAIGDEYDGQVVGQVQQDMVETFEQEGIRFTTTNGPRRHGGGPKADLRVPQAPQQVVASNEAPPPVPSNLDTRRAIAKMVCPDFPENYDFTLSPKKKLARLQADFEDRFDVLKAVYAAESDDMKALLLQEFPKAFEAAAS